MRDTFTVDYLNVGFVASLPIRIPVVSIGSGQPILSVLCGVHGDETASLIASHRFMKRLSAERSLQGTVRIITSANPVAQATRSRVTFSDSENLNRAGKGKPDGRLTARLAHTLCDTLSDSTLVIDLHEFGMDTPTMAVHIPSEDAATHQTILQNIAVFGPALVWAVPQDSTSIVGALIELGVAGFGVETSNAMSVTDEVIASVADGLYRVAQNLGVVEGAPAASPVTAYDIRLVTAERSGLWEPTRSIFDAVDEADVIGGIVPLPLIDDKEPVLAPGAGTILQLARRRLVDTGTDLFTIGQTNPQITEALRLAIQEGRPR